MKEQEFDKDREGTTGAEERKEMGEDIQGAITNNEENNTEQEMTQSDEAMEALRSERDEWQDKYVRLLAEFDNYKRRNARERTELVQTAGKDVIVSLLEVLDDADRALAQITTSDDLAANREGVSLVFNKLTGYLQSKGLKEMECAGDSFDPELHEAIAEIPVPTEELKGKIVEVVQKGYYLNDKLIRYAKVVVGK